MQSTFRALSDPTRRDILSQLRQAPQSIVALTRNFDITRAAVKKHLTVLSDGGLITMTFQGRETISALRPEGLAPVIDWLSYFDGFWDDRLNALKTAIEKDTK